MSSEHSDNRKASNIWTQNSTLLKHLWAKKEAPREITKCSELNWNKNTTYQKLLEIANALLGGKFVALNKNIKENEKSWNDHPSSSLKKLQKVK